MRNFLTEYKKRFKRFFLCQDLSKKYEIGGNLAHLDSFLTAKTGTPFVKQYRECRDVDLILVLDVSESQFCGRIRSNYNLMCSYVELMQKLAKDAGDRVGIVVFDEKIEKYLKPSHKNFSIKHLLKKFTDYSLPTDPLLVANFLQKVLKKSSTILWISDFVYPDNVHAAIMHDLKLIARKHDLICLQIVDSLHGNHANSFLQDAESSEIVVFKGKNKKYSRYLSDLNVFNHEKLKSNMKNLGIKFVQTSAVDAAESVLERCLDKHLA